jgi:diguanylate cyclase (GGDEF)-like protein
MSEKLAQRATVVALICAAIGGAFAAHRASTHDLESQRAHRAGDAQRHIRDALSGRAYYLEDVADMVGVHDDADVNEFSRYAHVRGRNERSVVSVQWLRRSPSGRLLPPADAGRSPILVAPGNRSDAALADAASRHSAAGVVRIAARRKQVAVSRPVRLAGGHMGFYLAVPVEGRRFSGGLGTAESRSAVVGLIDAQELVAEALAGAGPAALRLRDDVTPLASIGSGLHSAVEAMVPARGRRWSLSVDGGSMSALERALPWLILVLGLGLALAVQVMVGRASRRRDMALRLAREAHAEAERQSREDALTGIFNRRHFGDMLDAALARPDRPAPAVLLLDLDHFKRINDEHGHLTGDAFLRAAAERIASVLRRDDCLARWGGEEFAILAPATDAERALKLAERVRSVLAEKTVKAAGVAIELTASVGAAVAAPGVDTPDSLVNAADRALYDAKRAGRNCVRVWSTAVADTAVTQS